MSNPQSRLRITDGRNHTTHDHDAPEQPVYRVAIFSRGCRRDVVGGAAGQLLAREPQQRT